MKATEIGEQTCIGVHGEPPYAHGNCFSLKMDDGHYYRIANFNVENLEALLERGLKWPIECKRLSECIALIHDPRIGERWYQNRYCEICTPQDLWPTPQRDRREREIQRGRIVEMAHCTQINFDKSAEFE